MTLRTYRNRKKAEAEIAEEFEGKDLTIRKHIKRPLETYRFGFIVLCPDKNLIGFKNTIHSIKQLYPFSKILAVVSANSTSKELDDMRQQCETVVGDNTIMSLINTGMKNTQSPWNIIIFSGSLVKGTVYRHFDAFIKNERDILFPVVNGQSNFIDGSMNGIIIHKDTFAEIGDFIPYSIHKEGYNDIELIKLLWSTSALEKGCQFKAIIGLRIV